MNFSFSTWYEDNKKNPNWYRLLKKLNYEMFVQVDQWVEGQPAEKAFLFIENTRTKPLCNCGIPVKWYAGKGYTKRCSASCSAAATATQRSITLKNRTTEALAISMEKSRETNIHKYGADYARTRAMSRKPEALLRCEAARRRVMLEKYGTINPSLTPDAKTQRASSFAKRTAEQRALSHKKMMKTRIMNGHSIPDDHPSIMGSKKQYTRRVRYLTNKLTHLFEGRSELQHIDHKFSIYDGFKHQVDPRVIAHPKNLRLISRSQNSKKNSKSSISLDQLLGDIGNDFKGELAI